MKKKIAAEFAASTCQPIRHEAHTQPPAPPSMIAEPAPQKRPRGWQKIRVAKIDPDKGIRAIITVKADMKEVRKLVGKHIGEQLVTEIGGIHVRVACETVGKGKIWRVRGSLPIRGRALLYGFAGYGPADFPGDTAWLKRMIQFEPAGVDRAINDPREEADAGEDA